MQPLDVVCFQPYKHYHSEAVDENMRIGRTEFGVTDFLAELSSVRSKTFKQSTIQSAFRVTGLVPLSAAIVLEKLAAAKLRDELREYEAYQEEEEELTPEEQAWLELQITPTTPRQFELAGKEIDKCLRYSNEHFKHVFGKFGKGALAAAHAGALAIEELEQIRAAIAAKSRRSGTGGGTGARQVQKGGVIYVEQARHKVTKRQEDELAAARRLIAKDEAKKAKAVAKAAERIEIEARKAARTLAAATKRAELERRKADREEATRARLATTASNSTMVIIDPEI